MLLVGTRLIISQRENHASCSKALRVFIFHYRFLLPSPFPIPRDFASDVAKRSVSIFGDLWTQLWKRENYAQVQMFNR